MMYGFRTDYTLHYLLDKCSFTSLVEEEYRDLTYHTIALATKYISWLSTRSGYSFSALGLSVEDAAIDAIAEFLAEGESGPLHSIRMLMVDVNELPPAEKEARYTAAVFKTVQQYLPRVFTDINPVYGRLLRTLRRYTKDSEIYSFFHGIEGNWYGYKDDMSKSMHLESMPEEDLRRQVRVKTVDANPVMHTLVAILDTLKDYPRYRQAAGESFVIKFTIDILGTHLSQEDGYNEEHIQLHDDGNGKEVLVHTAARLAPWIREKYISRSKLTEEEAHAILEAAKSYAIEFSGGNDGFYEHLHSQLPDLTYDEYRDTIRHKAEYIVRRFFSTAQDVYLSMNENHVQ